MAREDAPTQAMAADPLALLPLSFVEILLDTLSDAPFFVKDANLRYVAANSAMLALCGAKSRDELIGRTAARFFSDPARRRYEALDRRVLATGAPIRDQLDPTLGATSRITWLLFTRLPVVAPWGQVVGVAAVSRRLPSPDHRHPTYCRLAAVTAQLQAEFDQPLKLPALARAARVSPSQLERDFRELFGVTLRQYQTKLRIEHATQRLEGGASIAEIAQASGYADQSAFTRRFRSVLGVTPSEYRARMRG